MRMPAAVAASAAAESKTRPLPPPAVLRLHRVAVPGKRGTDGYRNEFADIARGFALLGASQVAIADLFGVNVDTITDWKRAHPKFRRALDEGAIYADGFVATALYRRCIGYDTTITTTERRVQRDEAGNVVGTVEITTTEEKHVPPSVNACKHWLHLRRGWNEEATLLSYEDILNLLRAARKEANRRGFFCREDFKAALEAAQRRPAERCPECGSLIFDAGPDEEPVLRP
jgi:hypothetical protein